MKKILLLMIFCFICGKTFADIGIGFSVYGNFNDFRSIRNVSGWGFGGSLAMGDMRLMPIIFEAAGNYFGDGHAQMRTAFDWHFPFNISFLQIFFGLGTGCIVNFYPASPASVIAVGRIPMGIKVFLANVELFAGIAPQIGAILEPGSFYWSIDASTGIRIWF